MCSQAQPSPLPGTGEPSVSPVPSVVTQGLKGEPVTKRDRYALKSVLCSQMAQTEPHPASQAVGPAAYPSAFVMSASWWV